MNNLLQLKIEEINIANEKNKKLNEELIDRDITINELLKTNNMLTDDINN